MTSYEFSLFGGPFLGARCVEARFLVPVIEATGVVRGRGDVLVPFWSRVGGRGFV